MKFEKRIATMNVNQIIEEIRKHTDILSWEEEVNFFCDTQESPVGYTVLKWTVCEGCISKCRTINDRKRLDLNAWANAVKWTDKFSKEGFLEFLITNFFDEEITRCTQKAWLYLQYEIEKAFRIIEENS